MEEITEPQKKEIRRLGNKLLFKSFLTGIHHALMMLAMNIVLHLGVATFLGSSKGLEIVGAIGICIFILRRQNAILKERNNQFLIDTHAILEKK